MRIWTVQRSLEDSTLWGLYTMKPRRALHYGNSTPEILGALYSRRNLRKELDGSLFHRGLYIMRTLHPKP